jgi:hypothetical protein
MPYLTQTDRFELDDGQRQPVTAGELNYAITRLLVAYVRRQGKRYETLNAVIGAVEGAKSEFYRRVVAPYEDHKCAVNGDVYGSE